MVITTMKAAFSNKWKTKNILGRNNSFDLENYLVSEKVE